MNASSNVHAISDAASVAFSKQVPCQAPGCVQGVIGICACEICEGSGHVAVRPFKVVLGEVLKQLATSYVFGAFDCSKNPAGVHELRFVQTTWSARNEARAAHEAERALLRAGYSAWTDRGVVRVRAARPADETRPAFDHEQCVHNQDPRPETLAECEREARAA